MLPVLFFAGTAALFLSGCLSEEDPPKSSPSPRPDFDDYSKRYQDECEQVPDILEQETACDAASIYVEENVVGECKADLYIPPSTQDLESLLYGYRCQATVSWQATSNHIDGHTDLCQAVVTTDGYGTVKSAESLGEYDDYARCDVR